MVNFSIRSSPSRSLRIIIILRDGELLASNVLVYLLLGHRPPVSVQGSDGRFVSESGLSLLWTGSWVLGLCALRFRLCRLCLGHQAWRTEQGTRKYGRRPALFCKGIDWTFIIIRRFSVVWVDVALSLWWHSEWLEVGGCTKQRQKPYGSTSP